MKSPPLCPPKILFSYVFRRNKRDSYTAYKYEDHSQQQQQQEEADQQPDSALQERSQQSTNKKSARRKKTDSDSTVNWISSHKKVKRIEVNIRKLAGSEPL